MRLSLSEVMLGEIATVLKPVVVAEAKRLVAAMPETAEELAQRKADAEIMAACKAVAAASDALAQAEFTDHLGHSANARRRLIAAAAQLGKVMRKHGRFTGELG